MEFLKRFFKYKIWHGEGVPGPQMLRISYKLCIWLAPHGQIYGKTPNFDSFGDCIHTFLPHESNKCRLYKPVSYQLLGWVIIINGDGVCRLRQPVQGLQADSQPKSSGLVLRRRTSLGAVLHSSNEPGELSQWLCHDDSTINTVLDIIIIYYYYYTWWHRHVWVNNLSMVVLIMIMKRPAVEPATSHSLGLIQRPDN